MTARPIHPKTLEGRATDHAMVRYVTRVLGISAEELEEMTFPRAIAASMRGMDGTVPIKCDGEVSHVVVVRAGQAVTVLTPEQHRHTKARLRGKKGKRR
jgi:hypothetical protein